MTTLHLKAIVTPQKQIIVDLPDDVQPGEEVEITVQLPELPLSDAEFNEIMKTSPKTGAEIVQMLNDMGPSFLHITDSEAWVENLRRQSQREDK